MAILTSTVEIALRDTKSIIEIEITDWRERNGAFTAEVTDFYFKPYSFTDDDGNLVTGAHRLECNKRNVPVPAAQVALLSEMIAPLIPSGTPEPARREIEKTYGLLNIVQNDFVDEEKTLCVYFTPPSVWIIKQ